MNNENVLTEDFYKELEFVGEHKNAPSIDTGLLRGVLLAKGSKDISSDPDRCLCLQNYFMQVRDFRYLGFVVEINLRDGTYFCPIARLEDDGLHCVVELDNIPPSLEAVEKWIEDNAKKFKIRIGDTVHIKKVIRMMEALFKPYADEIILDQNKLKEYINGCNRQILYVYATPSLDNYSFEDMNRLTLECYAVQENSSSTSCMTKKGGDWRKIGADFRTNLFQDCILDNGVWVHPFHTYNTRDWQFVFVSKHAPEKVLNWNDESKSPFIARAIAFNNNAYSEEAQKWYVRHGNVCYGAREIAKHAILAHYPQSDDTSGCKIRLYNSRYDDRIMAYIDGDYQYAGVISNNNTEETAEETAEGKTIYYDIAVVGEKDGEGWENTSGTAIAEAKYHYEFCEIMSEDILADEAVWISALEGYVHRRFTNFSGELDGLAIFHWFK